MQMRAAHEAPVARLAKSLPDFSSRRAGETIDDAFERGRAEGRAEAAVEALREREKLEEAFEARLAVVRRAVAGEAGARLSAEIAAANEALRRELEVELVRVLAPIAGAAVRTRAMAAFGEAVRKLVEGGEAIEVSGPSGLLEAFAAGLGSARGSVTLTAGDGEELSARAGRTRITSRLEAWANALRPIAGDDGGGR
jgi:hypothetical protein